MGTLAEPPAPLAAAAGRAAVRSRPLGLALKLLGLALLAAQVFAPWDAIISFFGRSP